MRQILEELLVVAKLRGIDEADVMAIDTRQDGVSARNGSIEKVGSCHNISVSLRLFRDMRKAQMATRDISEDGLKFLLEKTCEMLPYSSPDQANGLPPISLCQGKLKKLDLFDAAIHKLTRDDHMQMTCAMERAAVGHDSRIKTIRESQSSSRTSVISYLSTHGIYRAYRASRVSLSIEPVAEDKSGMQTDGWYGTARHLSNLDSPDEIGKIAAVRALRKLGGKKVETQITPVVLDPEVSAEFIKTVAGAISGEAIYRKTSFLHGKIGTRIASSLLTIRDNATMPRGLGSHPFDSEGVVSGPATTLINDGFLSSYILDSYSARRLDMTTTGHAGGISNLYLEADTHTPEEIMASVERGLYVTEFYGHGINLLTGDFSMGAKGLWIDRGTFAYPVQEITVAGNLKNMLMDIEMVGNDLTFRSQVSAPTIKISKMMVAGS
ncbi:MAG: TldD/PmbA family protein [Candidatus Sungbacteria bacterium]|nr:TldD/PmbA family protein [Candidatus Sungbacteria bacterium]